MDSFKRLLNPKPDVYSYRIHINFKNKLIKTINFNVISGEHYYDPNEIVSRDLNSHVVQYLNTRSNDSEDTLRNKVFEWAI